MTQIVLLPVRLSREPEKYPLYLCWYGLSTGYRNGRRTSAGWTGRWMTEENHEKSYVKMHVVVELSR